MSASVNNRELEQLENELQPALSTYMTKSPSHKQTDALLEALQPEMERVNRTSHPSIFKQCVIQMRHYRWQFWSISAALFLMLSLIAPSFFRSGDSLFPVILPLYIFSGIGYSYRSWNKEMRMVEMVTPFPPALLLLVRMINVLVINIFLGLLGSVYLAVSVKMMPFLFVLEWLAPSLLIFGLLAYVMLWKGMKSGLAAALVVWLGFLAGPEIMNGLGMSDFVVIVLVMSSFAGLGLSVAAYFRAAKQYRFEM